MATHPYTGAEPKRPNADPEQLEFARTEFFHIMKQQTYIGMLGISIMGIVTPIFVSLLFQYDQHGTIGTTVVKNTDILIAIVLVLSFVYAVLAKTYITLSIRRGTIVDILKEELRPWFGRYIAGEVPQDRDPLRSYPQLQPFRNWFLINAWTAAKGVILVAPCIACMIGSYYYLISDPRDSIVIKVLLWTWYAFVVLDAFLLVAAASGWATNRQWGCLGYSLFILVVFLALTIASAFGIYSLAKGELARRDQHSGNFATPAIALATSMPIAFLKICVEGPAGTADPKSDRSRIGV